ncbi:hypothetical protein [Flavimarina sp. Hel_I_48]|uniref:hypothetical protein n=1 Tax=Flavimarina sp. Hel_I_48 TaxID=1392488 RepID=UPI0004DF2332|nr:hypothetical protein [Flavimarina sp. Hel_I_48]
MDIVSAKYRIAYEAFSQFSGKLSKAETFDELGTVIKRDIKYLFDHKLFRILFKESDANEVFTFYKKDFWIEPLEEVIFSYEEELLLKHIPFCKNPHEFLFEKYVSGRDTTNPLLWGWYFKYNELEVCVSILADDQGCFDNSDVQILKLLVDNIATKYEQIVFKNKLEIKNKNLKEALELIEEKNRQIKHIVNNQKNIIAERTKEVRNQNKMLVQVSRMNAHNVREPLSRILGLIEIAEAMPIEELNSDLLPYLKISAQDLDISLKQIVEMSGSEVDKILNE